MSPVKETARIPEQGSFAKRDVLVEYDGPRLAVFTSAEKDLRIGTLIEASAGGAERWLVADVSRLELQALAAGILSAHEAFEKQARSIVDFKHGKPALLWNADDPALFEDALPVIGAILPDEARSILTKKFPEPRSEKSASRRVRFDGRRIRDSQIEFSALSRLLGTLQGVWTALAQTIGVETVKANNEYAPSALIADARLARGSVAVALRPTDEAAFDAILSQYHEVMRATYGDIDAVRARINSADVTSKLRDYLGALSDCEADASFESPTERVYTGYSRARLVRRALRPIPKAAVPETANPQSETLTKRGYFDGIEVSGNSFVFVDIESGESLTGTLGPGIADRIRTTSARVGGNALFYRAVFSMAAGSAVLLDFQGLQTELDL